MMKTTSRRLLLLLMVMVMAVSIIAIQASATTVTVLDGQVSITDSANSNTVSGDVVTITAKGSLFSKKTNDITITNETANVASLSFDYVASTYNTFKIAGATAAASGTYTVVLDAGASLAIQIISNNGMSNTTATLKLSNISLIVASDSSSVTINYDSTLGSVTAGGSAVASGDSVEATLTDGLALVAAPNSGTTFLGWVNAANGEILSSSASFTLKPASDVTVKPAFAKNGSTPWFAVGAATQKSASSGLLGMSKIYYYTVGTSYLFDDLNAAATAAAASASNKAVVLMNSGTLPAGTYTIPAGVTLLIPFDSANTMYTTQAQSVGMTDSSPADGIPDGGVTPTEYRTLTLSDGAKLTINGAMSISAKHYYGQGSKACGGSPCGNVSFVRMKGSSNITINNGGALYAYGYITGSGSVTANSGATVYENFQIMDFRGGTQSTDMDNGVFPLSQYYVQNIEVPLTLYSGATEYAYTTIYMSSADFGSAVAFIAKSNAMFNLTSGYVVKRYDGATDRLVVEANGNMTVSSINMTVGTSSINSKDYELPINSNITLTVKSGANITINQDIALLPGSKIIVEAGAICTLGSGNNIYIYDADQWGNFTFGAASKNTPFKAVAYAPGRTYTRTNADMVDAEIVVNGTMDASAGYVYTTTGGANIYSSGNGVVKTQSGTQTTTHQLVQGTGYTAIPLTPAKLKNADGSYLTTQTAEYIYSDGKWICNGEHGFTETVVAPTCEDGGYTVHNCTVCGYSYCDNETAALGHTEVVDAAVEATCTETGLTEGKHCSVCGEVIVAQTETAALGHTAGEAVKENETASSYDLVTYCTVCKAELSRETVQTGPVMDSNMKFQTTSLSFQEYIGLQFIVKQSMFAGYDSHYAVITQLKPNADTGAVTGYIEDRIEMVGTPSGTASNPTYVFSKDIQSWSMTDVVTITLYGVKDGVVYQGETRTTSVMEQAYLKLGQFAGNANYAPHCKILADMLTYGAAVQVAFNHDAADLPNARLEELGYSSFVTTSIPNITAENTVTGTGSITVRATSLSLQQKVDLQLVFTNVMTGYKAVVTLADGEPFEVYPDGNMKRFTLTALPYKMRETYTVVICDATTGEAVSPTYTYSIESVAKTKLGNTEAFDQLVYAMLNYGDAVSAIV